MDFKAQYLAAIKRDQDVRDAAFLGLTTNICGVQVRQMTVPDVLIIEGLGNPFLAGGIHSVQDAIKFLWLLSPKYQPGKWAAFWFARQHRKIDDENLTEGIRRYLDDTFQDSPGSRDKQGPDFASFAAHIVHRLGTAYGWSVDEIMRLPLKVIFQMLKCIRRDGDEKPELRSRRVLKVHGDRLRLINERNRLIAVLRNRLRTN